MKIDPLVARSRGTQVEGIVGSSMPSGTQIRDAAPDDAPVLARIHLTARAVAMPWLTVAHDERETEKCMAVHVIPRHRVRVATVGGVAVGFAAFTDGWLEQLYVQPFSEPRHRLGAVPGRLRQSVGPFSVLGASAQHGAVRFYERRGCRLLMLTDGRDNEEREPDALYEKSLPA